MFTITWWATIMRLQFNIMIHNTIDSWTVQYNSYMMRSSVMTSLITSFMGPTWGPSGADRTQVGPMLAPWTLLSGILLTVRLWWRRNVGQSLNSQKDYLYLHLLRASDVASLWLTWTHMTMRYPGCVCVTNDANGYARCDDIFLSNKHRFFIVVNNNRGNKTTLSCSTQKL